MAVALLFLFAGFAVPAKAMLMTLYFKWDTTDVNTLKNTYHIQEGSIIQVIGYKYDSTGEEAALYSAGVTDQFGDAYGKADDSDTTPSQPFTTSDTSPRVKDVYLASNTQKGHEILYTGAVQQYSTWYG